jgi:hypothetical protein
VPLNGYFRFALGTDFGVNSVSSAVSRFQLVSGTTPYASSYNVTVAGGVAYIWCLTTRIVPANTRLTATLAGVRNPRYTVINGASTTN